MLLFTKVKKLALKMTTVMAMVMAKSIADIRKKLVVTAVVLQDKNVVPMSVLSPAPASE